MNSHILNASNLSLLELIEVPPDTSVHLVLNDEISLTISFLNLLFFISSLSLCHFSNEFLSLSLRGDHRFNLHLKSLLMLLRISSGCIQNIILLSFDQIFFFQTSKDLFLFICHYIFWSLIAF